MRRRAMGSIVSCGLVGVAGMWALGGMASGALGQVMTITSQNRFVQGTTMNTAEDGSVTTNGPVREEAPTGDFGTWTGVVSVPGNISVQANVTGGYDGAGTISMSALGMTIGGGGGANTAGTSSATVHFEYTFQVLQNATYTIDGLLGSQAPIVATFQLTGPGVAISRSSSTGDISFSGETGTLAPGSYTLAIELGGTVSYVGPGGNGAGGGGTPFTFVVAASGSTCAADFNNSGSLTVQDIFDFLSAWFAGNASADFDHQNGITVQDIFDFLGAWFAGC